MRDREGTPTIRTDTGHGGPRVSPPFRARAWQRRIWTIAALVGAVAVLDVFSDEALSQQGGIPSKVSVGSLVGDDVVDRPGTSASGRPGHALAPTAETLETNGSPATSEPLDAAAPPRDDGRTEGRARPEGSGPPEGAGPPGAAVPSHPDERPGRTRAPAAGTPERRGPPEHAVGPPRPVPAIPQQPTGPGSSVGPRGPQGPATPPVPAGQGAPPAHTPPPRDPDWQHPRPISPGPPPQVGSSDVTSPRPTPQASTRPTHAPDVTSGDSDDPKTATAELEPIATQSPAAIAPVVHRA